MSGPGVPNDATNFATLFTNAACAYDREEYRRMLRRVGLIVRWNKEIADQAPAQETVPQ